MFPLLSFTFACDAEDIIKIIADLFDRPEKNIFNSLFR